MRVITSLFFASALLVAAPAAAQDNAISNDAVAVTPGNDAVSTDMNGSVDTSAAPVAPEAAAPEAAPAADDSPPPPASRGFPWGVLGLLGLVGLLGAKKAKS